MLHVQAGSQPIQISEKRSEIDEKSENVETQRRKIDNAYGTRLVDS